MAAKIKATKGFAGRKIVITRVINAPCKIVFRAWTDPKQMVQWWSPDDIGCKSVEADVKIDGAYRIHMICGKDNPIAIGKYKKIVPNKLLKFTWQWEHYAMPNSVVTVEFEDLGKKTRLTLIHEGLPDEDGTPDHKLGWTSAIKKFAALIKQNKIKA